MSVRVRVPGAIIASDGIQDSKNEVDWVFISPAVMVRDVTLRIVYRP